MFARLRLVFLMLILGSWQLLGQTANTAGLPQSDNGQVPQSRVHTLALSHAAKDKIQSKLSEGADNELYVFNRNGETDKQIPLSGTTLESHPSLIDLLKSTSSPISNCRDPEPAPPPPPGCVLCSSGKIVCAKGFKETGK